MNTLPTINDSARVHRTPHAVLALALVALTLEGYDLIVFGTVVPALLDYAPWGLTPESAGILGSLAVVGMLVGALAAGAVTDVLGRRRIMIFSVSLFSIAMGLCALAPSPEWFGAFRLLVGIGAGGLMPTVVALVVEYSPSTRRNLNTAIAFAGVGLGGALAGLLAILLVPAYGFRIMFALGLVPLIVVLPMMLRYLPESISYLLTQGRYVEAAAIGNRFGIAVEAVRSQRSAVTDQRRRRDVLATLFAGRGLAATLLFWVATFCCLLVLFGANAWLPALMLNAGYPIGSALSFLLVLNLGAVVGTLAASLVADRIGSKPVTVFAFTLAAVSLLLLVLRPPTAVVYVLVAFAGLGTTGTQILINAYVACYHPTATRATALGLSLGVGRLGGIIGPAYGGLVVASGLGLSWQFYAFAVPAVIGGVVIALVPRALTTSASQKSGTADQPQTTALAAD